MATLISWLKFSGARLTTGDPVSSGSAYFYVRNSTSKQVATWADAEATKPLAQPIPLNAAGQAEVYVSDPCDIAVYNSAGARVLLSLGATDVTAKQVEIASPYFTGRRGTDYGVQLPTTLDAALGKLGASLGVDGYYRYSANPLCVSRKVQDVLRRDGVSPYDFGAVGDGLADDTIPLQTAINQAAANKAVLYLDAGTFNITSALTVNAEVKIIGAGKGISRITSALDTFSALSIACAAGARAGERFSWVLRDFSIEMPVGTDAWNIGISVSGDTVLLTGAGGIIDNVDVKAGLGIACPGARGVRISNCNITAQMGAAGAVGLDLGPSCTATGCLVDGVAYSGAHVSTGIKLGFYATAERCTITNCTTGIEFKSGVTRAIARNCEAASCGTSYWIRGAGCGPESCTSSSATLNLKVDAALAHVVDINNSWAQPFLKVASDVSAADLTYVNITDLTLNLVSGVTYDIEFCLRFEAGSTEGIRFQFAGSSGTATLGTAIEPRVLYQYGTGAGYTPAVAGVGIDQTVVLPLEAAGPTSGFATIRSLVTCTATGTLIPAFSQSVAGATVAKVKTNSWATVKVL